MVFSSGARLLCKVAVCKNSKVAVIVIRFCARPKLKTDDLFQHMLKAATLFASLEKNTHWKKSWFGRIVLSDRQCSVGQSYFKFSVRRVELVAWSMSCL